MLTASNKRRWLAFLRGEAHWLARWSCLAGTFALWVSAMRWANEGRPLLSVIVVAIAGAGCVFAWRFLGRMTAADIGRRG